MEPSIKGMSDLYSTASVAKNSVSHNNLMLHYTFQKTWNRKACNRSGWKIIGNCATIDNNISPNPLVVSRMSAALQKNNRLRLLLYSQDDLNARRVPVVTAGILAGSTQKRTFENTAGRAAFFPVIVIQFVLNGKEGRLGGGRWASCC